VLRVRVGAGVAVARPWAYFSVPVDLGVRIVRGLFLDGSAHIGATKGEAGNFTLPVAALGLSWRFETAVVQPRFGAAVQVGVDASGGPVKGRPGFIVRGGVDLVPEEARPLLVGVDVQGGMLGTGTFFFAAGAGAGLRF
jgi:hypothetical protein